MVRFDDIPDEIRQIIADQAAPLMLSHDRDGLGAPRQALILGPSLQEEFLSLDAIAEDSPSMPELTGQTISLLQIPQDHATLGAGPDASVQTRGYVRAGPKSSDDLGAVADAWSVTAVSSSDLSTRIQSAVEWLDTQEYGDPVVRVLTIPSYQLTALALHEDDIITGIIPLPLPGDNVFEQNRIYALQELKTRLRELPSAEGLSFTD